MYNPNDTCTHMLCHPLPFGATPYLLVPPRRSGATLRRNLGLSRARTTYRLRQIPEPGEGSNVQLFSWLCFIGHYQVTKQGYNPPLQKIPPDSRFLGVYG